MADELAKKFVDADFRYAILKLRAGFGWPFSATGPKTSIADTVAAEL
jgi:hypothetical protein